MAMVGLWRSGEITASWKQESEREVEKDQLSGVIIKVWHCASLCLHYFKHSVPPAVLIVTNSYRCFVACRSTEIMAIICAMIVLPSLLRLKWTPPKHSLMHFKLNAGNSYRVCLSCTLSLWCKKSLENATCSLISSYFFIQVISKWDWGQIIIHILMPFWLFIFSLPLYLPSSFMAA